MARFISFRSCTLSIILFFSLVLSAHAQTSDGNSFVLGSLNPRGALPMSNEEKRHIAELLQISGAISLSKTLPSLIIDQITSTLRAANPAIPANIISIISEETNKAFTERMEAPGGRIELSTALYHKYFSDEEIQQMLAFYASPIGKKSVTVLPLLAKEALADGQRVGRDLTPVVLQRIKDRLASQIASASAEHRLDMTSSSRFAPAESTVLQQPQKNKQWRKHLAWSI